MNVRFAVITVSDRSARGQRPDATGPALAEMLQAQGWVVTRQEIVSDDAPRIRRMLTKLADGGEVDVILTAGGTGFARRDITPEATLAVIEREAPGLSEAMRAASITASPHSMLSRARAGIRRRTLIVNLPGSPSAAVENLRVVMPALEHAAQLLREDPQAEAGHSKAAV